MLWGSKCLQTGLSQALPARCGRLDSASRHTKTRIDCYTAAMDGRLPGPRKRAYFQVPHLVLGRPSRGEKTDGRERHGPRSTSPVSPRPARIYDTHPQPQTDRNRHRLRESDVTLPGWGSNLGWRQESRDTVHSGRQPPGRVSAVTSDHIVMM